MYYTYVLQSEVDQQFYVGYSKDLKLRFERHKNGYIESTKNRRPLALVYWQYFDSFTEARKRESWLKSGTGRTFLRKLLEM